jgi:hypothetical protein
MKERPIQRPKSRLQDCHLRFDEAVRTKLESYCEREGLSLARAVRKLLLEALDRDKNARLDQEWKDSTAAAELFQMRAEQAQFFARLFHFIRRLGRSAFGAERLLVHWAGTSGSLGVTEDELLAEIRSVGENLVQQVLAEPDEDESAEPVDESDPSSRPH